MLTSLGLGIAIPGRAPGQTPNDDSTPSKATAHPFPYWAYPWDPNFKVPSPDEIPQRLPSSDASFSWAQARDLFFSPDWHPADHAPMPAVVASGRKPDVRACGSCHRAEGTGGPENSGLAGLPV